MWVKKKAIVTTDIVRQYDNLYLKKIKKLHHIIRVFTH